MTTEELDVIVHEECINNKCYPSPLLYKGFPKSVCTSVNNVACHGIPDSRPLEDGDIINVDVTVSTKDLLRRSTVNVLKFRTPNGLTKWHIKQCIPRSDYSSLLCLPFH